LLYEYETEGRPIKFQQLLVQASSINHKAKGNPKHKPVYERE